MKMSKPFMSSMIWCYMSFHDQEMKRIITSTTNAPVYTDILDNHVQFLLFHTGNKINLDFGNHESARIKKCNQYFLKRVSLQHNMKNKWDERKSNVYNGIVRNRLNKIGLTWRKTKEKQFLPEVVECQKENPDFAGFSRVETKVASIVLIELSFIFHIQINLSFQKREKSVSFVFIVLTVLLTHALKFSFPQK